MTKTHAKFMAGFFVLALSPLEALAQSGDSNSSYDGDADEKVFSLTVGAGVTDFSRGEAKEYSDLGYLWEVRGALGFSQLLGAEVAYIGTRHGFSGDFLDDVNLTGHGVEGALRVNLGVGNVQPYVLGGLGYTRYSVDLGDNTLDLPGDDDVYTIPVGAGVGFASGNLIVDLRGTYRYAISDEVIREEQDVDNYSSLDTWSAVARVGFIF